MTADIICRSYSVTRHYPLLTPLRLRWEQPESVPLLGDSGPAAEQGEKPEPGAELELELEALPAASAPGNGAASATTRCRSIRQAATSAAA